MKFINILKSRFITHSPLILSHQVTSLCNAQCKICNLWKKSSQYKDDLSKGEIFDMLEKAKKAGIIGYVAWGGEPLLRKELPDILEYAKKKNFSTTVITNGYFLKDVYKEITPFTDLISISIDSNDELHDKMRGVVGIKQRAIEGIELCKNTETKVVINSIISKLNLDKIEGLVNLSKELNVPIVFEPMDIIDDGNYNRHLQPTNEELKKVFSEIWEYKKNGYKINNSYQYLENFTKPKKYLCHAPKCFVIVDPQGNVTPCLNTNFGNIKKKSFEEIFNSKKYKEFCMNAERCNECNGTSTIESSLAYSLNPFLMFAMIKNLSRY